MNIIERFIPKALINTRPGIQLDPKYITIHETDNTGFKANAEAHARLQESGNSRQASWHLQVDDTYCIQSIPFNEVAWAAGDGANGPGNRTSIHLEICVNQDGDYKKAVANAADVTRQLMKQFSIPLDHVVQHNHWSGKNCPRILRSGSVLTWDDFLHLLQTPKWDGVEMQKGQIGRITVLKPINLWKRDEKGNLCKPEIRVLKKGEIFPVFQYDEKHGGQYFTGEGWITNMEGYVRYETPSKSLLEQAK